MKICYEYFINLGIFSLLFMSNVSASFCEIPYPFTWPQREEFQNYKYENGTNLCIDEYDPSFCPECTERVAMYTCVNGKWKNPRHSYSCSGGARIDALIELRQRAENDVRESESIKKEKLDVQEKQDNKDKKNGGSSSRLDKNSTSYSGANSNSSAIQQGINQTSPWQNDKDNNTFDLISSLTKDHADAIDRVQVKNSSDYERNNDHNHTSSGVANTWGLNRTESLSGRNGSNCTEERVNNISNSVQKRYDFTGKNVCGTHRAIAQMLQEIKREVSAAGCKLSAYESNYVEMQLNSAKQGAAETCI